MRCLLGLTATATLSTALDIAQHLDINDQDGIAVRSAAVPSNLQLSVSMDREKDQVGGDACSSLFDSQALFLLSCPPVSYPLVSVGFGVTVER